MKTASLNHPLWVGSLVLLLVNDHLLKGADVLPAMVTGKLSDVAGLVVAPALLASVLPATRGARSFAYGLTGAVFAALQVVPGLAAGWDAALGAVGIPWQTFADPTDLLALPALLVSWWALRPQATERRPAPVLQAVGFAACIATSPPPEPLTDWPTQPSLEAQVALVNDGEEIVTVLVRQLREEVVLDCQRLRDGAPGELLSDELFGGSVEWVVEPNQAFGALENPFVFGDCHAVLLDGPTIEPRVLFWLGREALWGEADPTNPDGFAVSLNTFDDLARDLVFAWAPRDDAECEVPSPLERVDWASPGNGTFTIAAVESSPDGCLSVDVGDDEPLFLCMPEASLGFEAGDDVELFATSTALVITGDTRRLTLAHLSDDGASLGDLVFQLFPEVGCGWRIDDECGHTTGDVGVRVGLPTATGTPVTAGGLPVGIEAVGETHLVTVTRGESRIAYASDCGRSAGPYDVDVIVETTLE